MAGLFSFEVIGLTEVGKGIGALQDAIKDLRPFWKDVFAPKYFGIVQDLFATAGRARGEGGKFKGGAWPWLSPAYRIWKEAHYPGKPILVRKGHLRESVRWHGAPGPEGIFEATATYAIAGTRIPYGKYHQKGTSKMPARPFLPPPDPKVFAPLMKEWLLKASQKKA
jgi:phage gpG-like protein